ncbi:MAG TPA: DinB family protein [Gemmatimonadales bacterium]|jgi:hypothetical protein
MTQRWRTERPGADEHAPYYTGYIAEVPSGKDLIKALEHQGSTMAALVRGIPESRGDFRYAEGKWSIKDVVLHVNDAERIFSYRALRFARNDATELPGFDEGNFAANGNASSRTLADLAAEFEAIRASTLALMAPLDDVVMARRGRASGHGVTARAIAWIVAGHGGHHEKVLREKYLMG